MILRKLILFIVILISTCSVNTYGQFFLLNNNETPNVELSFSRANIEAQSKSTVFNVLKVVNLNQTQQFFTVGITFPDGWSIIGSDKVEVSLAPLDSIYIPIRIAIGGRVRGDIGYSIIAAVTDQRGQIIKNEYCFVKIKRQVDTRIRLINRINYIEQATRTVDVNIHVDNRGNREEFISFLFEGDKEIQLDQTRLSTISKDFTIPAFTDTIISTKLFFADDFSAKSLYRLNVTAKTIDSVYRSTAWFNDIDSRYINHIPDAQRLLIAEIIARGVFSSYSKPLFGAKVFGNVLLKKQRELFYYYQTDNIVLPDYIYKYNRMWAGYKHKGFMVRVGDITTSMDATMQGRGGEIFFNRNTITIKSIVTHNVRNELNNAGLSLNYRIIKNLSLDVGAIYNEGSNRLLDSKMGFLGTNFSVFNKHQFRIKGIFNPITFTHNNQQYTSQAYGGNLNYSALFWNNRINLRAVHGSPYLYSGYAGKTYITLTSHQIINQKSNLNTRFNLSSYNPYTYRDNPNVIKGFTTTIEGETHYGRFINPKIFLYAGPGFNIAQSDNFSAIATGVDVFKTNVGTITLGSRLIGLIPKQTISLQIINGIVDVNNAPNLIADPPDKLRPRKTFSYQYLSGSIRNPNWSLQAMYVNGPRSLYEQFSWYYHSRPSKYIRIMPSAAMFIYKDIIRLESSVSFSNDLVTSSNYANITTQLFCYFPKNWTLRALNVYSTQSRVNQVEAIERYSNLYFEFALRKEFDIQQPRQKFYDLDIQFFKDFNGNGAQESNEPGIKNVYVNIQRMDEGISNFSSFVSGELLSDEKGKVSFDKIPAGTYSITYYPVGNDAGTFTKALDELTMVVDKNSVQYFPFVEKNKVFGKIILNRSRLSGLGRIDLANVRITATDSYGRSFTTLTDNNGEFVIFAPVTDEYILTINNIFYENFDLRQNNFVVQFNGYKQ
ncbi:MAG TPA: SdrD B-like domain-containing protein, partial [Tenuifilaceae bacterium]|nr:SdrD B-like domain-containing protein [Tenuifilaceae bacterium]